LPEMPNSARQPPALCRLDKLNMPDLPEKTENLLPWEKYTPFHAILVACIKEALQHEPSRPARRAERPQ
jgi:hypothetical protein